MVFSFLSNNSLIFFGVRYPFIGSGPHLAPNLHVVIGKMRQIYGKIFSVYLGNEPLVIVADFDLYKEAMAKDELLYRPKLGANDDFFFPDENGKNYHQHLEGLNNLFL